MTALLLANIKLALLFVLVGAIITLSALGKRRMPRAATARQRRRFSLNQLSR